MSARTGRLLLGSCLELCCFFLASFVLFFFFFFQAEDGIRDWSVTGVQTCALPICFVKTLAKPGGNITGFINQEGAIVGKWLQLLKEIDPRLKKAAAIFNPETATGLASYFLPSFEAAAETLRISPVLVPVYSDADIEQKISSLGTGPEIGLVIIPDGGFMTVHRKVVVAQASRFKIP